VCYIVYSRNVAVEKTQEVKNMNEKWQDPSELVDEKDAIAMGIGVEGKRPTTDLKVFRGKETTIATVEMRKEPNRKDPAKTNYFILAKTQILGKNAAGYDVQAQRRFYLKERIGADGKPVMGYDPEHDDLGIILRELGCKTWKEMIGKKVVTAIEKNRLDKTKEYLIFQA